MFRSTVKNEKEGFVGSFNILSILAFEVLKLSRVDGESRPESLKKASSESLTPKKFPPIVQSLGVKPSCAHFFVLLPKSTIQSFNLYQWPAL